MWLCSALALSFPLFSTNSYLHLQLCGRMRWIASYPSTAEKLEGRWMSIQDLQIWACTMVAPLEIIWIFHEFQIIIFSRMEESPDLEPANIWGITSSVHLSFSHFPFFSRSIIFPRVCFFFFLETCGKKKGVSCKASFACVGMHLVLILFSGVLVSLHSLSHLTAPSKDILRVEWQSLRQPDVIDEPLSQSSEGSWLVWRLCDLAFGTHYWRPAILLERRREWGAWVSQTVKRLPSAQVIISGSWDQLPHQASHSVGSLLLLPLLLLPVIPPPK